MTGLSLRSYISTAREAGVGEVRIAKGTTDQLVNKGTFGNRVASFFQDTARAIGLMKPDPTRALRQQGALDGFKDALEGHFGKALADAALHAAGLDAATGLTGAAMITAADHAKAAQAQNRAANLAAVEAYAPPGPGEDAGPAFAKLAAARKPPLDPAGLGPSERLEFTTRLQESVLSESQLGRHPVGDDRVAELAKDVLKQVVKLSNADALGDAAAAREAYAAAMKDVLKGVATGKDVTALAARLTGVEARFGDLMRAEMIDEAGGAEVQELTETATRQAMGELRAENPALLAKAQANALKDDSPLRALFAAAEGAVRQEGFKEDVGSQERAAKASLLRSTATSLVTSLASAMGPHTASASGDVDRLDEAASIPLATLQKAQTALAAALVG